MIPNDGHVMIGIDECNGVQGNCLKPQSVYGGGVWCLQPLLVVGEKEQQHPYPCIHNLNSQLFALSIVPCRRDDPDISNCIIKAFEDLRPRLATGELGEGYRSPPLEPLYLDNIDLSRGRQFETVFSDIVVKGGSNFTINELSANATNLSFDLVLTLPRLDFTGKYFIKLNILLLDIQGRGNMRGYCENAKALVKIRGVRVPMSDGLEYVRFTRLPLKINVDVFKLHLDNLFNGDPILGAVGNTIINDNQDLYLSDVLPSLERDLSKKFLDIINIMMANITFDEMFPL
ncbi:protein takeout-like [Musca autumnalis]|uniref:protein takeout-like n=1 Tax=Musca autumnalis TaxID=221902 RepID=UPI003CEDE70E